MVLLVPVGQAVVEEDEEGWLLATLMATAMPLATTMPLATAVPMALVRCFVVVAVSAVVVVERLAFRVVAGMAQCVAGTCAAPPGLPAAAPPASKPALDSAWSNYRPTTAATGETAATGAERQSLGEVIGELSVPGLYHTTKGYILNINGERVDALGRPTRARGVAGGYQRYQARQANAGRWYQDPNTQKWWFYDIATGRWVENGGWN